MSAKSNGVAVAIGALAVMLGIYLIASNNDLSNISAKMDTAAREGALNPSQASVERDSKEHVDVPHDQGVPEGNAREMVDLLGPLADAGDREAARALYVKLTECKQASKSLPADMLAGHVDPSLVRPGEDQEAASERLEEARLEQLDKTQTLCEGITKKDYDKMVRWLTQAAMAGDIEAQLLYASSADTILGDRKALLSDPDAIIKYKQNALNFLNSAASSGSVEALQALSVAYQNGALINKDPIWAYAYWSAANKASHSPRGSDVLNHLSKDLDAKELSEAQARADSIYQRCCVSGE